MRLSEIMSQMGLERYAEAGLLIFFAIFLLVAVRAFLLTSKDEHASAARIPLGRETFASNARDSQS
ncbi:MAG TPA: hypothetical protein VHM70_13530 [Polyangiaceae bacterium]|jgi:cbb3-type cytochrome oxidase subunit 3|nr:hypothetical protein [Polyangiaceae bacterium]